MTSITAQPTDGSDTLPAPFRPRPGVAAFLNLLTAGLGHLYAGRPVRAVVVFLGVIALAAVLVRSSFAISSAALRESLLVLLLAVALLLIPLDGARVARRTLPLPQRRFQRWYILLLLWLAAILLVQRPAFRWVEANVTKSFLISSSSMMPTLMPGDYVLTSPRVASPVRRGDLVIYRVPDDPIRYVHRTVGLPGDTVAMRDFHLVVNGLAADSAISWQPDSESAAVEDSAFAWQRARLAPGVDSASYHPTYGTWGPVVLRPGELLIIGDNRPNSLDSRYRGPIATADLTGRPEWIYFSRDAASGRIRWSRFGQRVQ